MVAEMPVSGLANSHHASEDSVQALAPEEYPDSGGFARARELLARGLRLTDTDLYHLTIGKSWEAIRLNAEHHVVPAPNQMASCLAYALVHMSPGGKLLGVQTLLHAITQAENPDAYTQQVANIVQKQEHADAVRQLSESANADDRDAGRLFGEWLASQPT